MPARNRFSARKNAEASGRQLRGGNRRSEDCAQAIGAFSVERRTQFAFSQRSVVRFTVLGLASVGLLRTRHEEEGFGFETDTNDMLDWLSA